MRHERYMEFTPTRFSHSTLCQERMLWVSRLSLFGVQGACSMSTRYEAFLIQIPIRFCKSGARAVISSATALTLTLTNWLLSFRRTVPHLRVPLRSLLYSASFLQIPS